MEASTSGAILLGVGSFPEDPRCGQEGQQNCLWLPGIQGGCCWLDGPGLEVSMFQLCLGASVVLDGVTV